MTYAKRFTVSLDPISGQDNAPRVQAAAAAVGNNGKVVLREGIWQWDTPCIPTRGVTIECVGPGVEIVSSITPTNPNGHLQSVFSYDGFTSQFIVPNAVTYTVGSVPAGARTFFVAALPTGITIGSEILIGESDSTQAQQASAHIIENISGSPGAYILTIDRPLVHTFSNASPVTLGTVAKDIRLIGNGARISGTGDRAISLVSAWHSYAEGWELDGSGFTDYTISFDTGSFQSGYEHITVRNAGVIGFALEGCENCYRAHCYAENCAFMFQAAYNSTEEDCHANGHGAVNEAGIYLGWLDDTTACRGVKLIGSSYVGFQEGVYVGGSSHDIDIIGCDISYNTSHGVYVTKVSSTLLPGRVRVIGGEIRGNGGTAFYTNGPIGNLMSGVFTEGNASGARVTNGGELTIDNCRLHENNSGEQFVLLMQDSTSRMRVLNSVIRTVTGLGGFAVLNIQGGSLTASGIDLDFSGGGDGAMFYVSGGSAYIENCANIGSAISNGVVSAASSASVRLGPNTDFSNTTVPYVAVSGAALQLEKPSITIAPSGGDDAPFIHAALTTSSASGGAVLMMAGTYLINTVIMVPSNANLIANSGVKLVSSLTPTGGPGGFAQSVFYAIGSITGASTTVATQPSIGTYTVDVVSATGFTAGLTIAIYGENNIAQQFTILSVSSNTITLDEAIEFTFTVGKQVAVWTFPTNIRLIGNGATITGTGDRAFEIAAAAYCHITGWKITDESGFFEAMGASFDVAGRHNMFADMMVDGGASAGGGAGLALECQVGSSIFNSVVQRIGSTGLKIGIYIATSARFLIANSIITNCNYGILLAPSSAGDLQGCMRGVIRDTWATACIINGILIEGGQDLALERVTASGGPGGGSAGIFISAGEDGNGVQNIALTDCIVSDSGGDGLAINGNGPHVTVNGLIADRVGLYGIDFLAPNGECTITGYRSQDAIGFGPWSMNAAGGLLTINDGHVITTINGFWEGTLVSGTVRLYDYTCEMVGSPTGVKVLADIAAASVLELENVRTIGALGVGVYAGHGVAASVRRGDNVDFSSCVAPWVFDSSSAAVSYGSTFVDANGLSIYDTSMNLGGRLKANSLNELDITSTNILTIGRVAGADHALSNADQTINVSTGSKWIQRNLTNNHTVTVGTTGATGNDLILLQITRIDGGAFTYAVANGGTNGGTIYTFPVSTNGILYIVWDDVSGDWVREGLELIP